MTRETASRLVEQNLAAIYGYAYSKLFDKSRAEDLTSEIVLEILSSAENIKNDSAFWGFVWRIAENTLCKFIRREKIISQVLPLEDESIVNAVMEPMDAAAEEDEQIFLLRRELSLLTDRYRTICVSYYVNNKSCSEIAAEQNISVEAVKQSLFRARHLLKEGMEMERKLGEKSYNPGVFRLGFWGDKNYYVNICDRKLPGAILLAAYCRSMTAEELSLELGVAMPYLEEELETLEAAGLLQRTGKKYETNIVIITDEYEKAFEKETRGICAEAAGKAYAAVTGLLPQIRTLDFKGNDYDDNRLMFALLNIAFMNGYGKARELSPTGQPQKLALGGYGWVYGYDNDYENSRFCGIAMHAVNNAGTAWFSAENYTALLAAQNFVHRNFSAKVEGMCDAILEKAPDMFNETLPYLIGSRFILSENGRLSANFPVFRKDVYDELLKLLQPVSDLTVEYMIMVSDKGKSLLSAMVPTHLKGQCKALAGILHRLDVAAYMMEALIASGDLTVPEEQVPLCIYGVQESGDEMAAFLRHTE